VTRPAVIVAAALVGVAGSMWARANLGETAEDDDGGDWLAWLDTINPIAWLQGLTAGAESMHPNIRAALDMIQWAEGTAGRPDPYRVCYGYRHTIRDTAEHPAVSGEWAGEVITRGKYAGQRSTAAGAYQITRGTWRDARRALALPDFGQASQDSAAVWLIRTRCQALALIQAGRLAEAMPALSRVWASLPGSTAGQGGKRGDELARVYVEAGGVLA
jgi:lysozyme